MPDEVVQIVENPVTVQVVETPIIVQVIVGQVLTAVGGGSSVWGGITGSLDDQTDLKAALDGKATADQGAKADSALQPGASIPWTDVSGKPSTFSPSAHNHAIGDVTDLQDALDGKQAALGFTPENAAQKGVAGGYAGLDGTGKVPAAQLPAYVDDVIEAANFAALPGMGETGKIYVTLDTNKTWRWSGSAYVEISPSPGSTDSVTEGATNLYFTAARVLATVLTGYAAAGTRQALAAGDSVLGAWNKVGKWLADLGDAAFAAASAAGLAMLTAANAAAQTALLDTFTTALKGLVPPPGSASGKFLRDDGTWDTPAGGGNVEAGRKATWFPQGSGTTVYALGMTPSFTGTATAQAVATTSFYTMCKRIGYLVTAAATNAVANWRVPNLWTIGGTRSGEGGFKMTLRFGCSTGVATATTRLFAGFRTDGNVASDVNPSAGSAGMICFGWDAGDTNCQIIHKTTNSPTKIDLGSAFGRPSVDNTDVFEVELYSPPGTAQEVQYKVTRLNTGAVATGTITTNLPAATVFGSPHIYYSVGGTSSVIGLSIMKVTMESDF